MIQLQPWEQQWAFSDREGERQCSAVRRPRGGKGFLCCILREGHPLTHVDMSRTRWPIRSLARETLKNDLRVAWYSLGIKWTEHQCRKHGNDYYRDGYPLLLRLLGWD